MKQLTIFIWSEPKNRVYLKAPGGVTTHHEMRIIPPPDYLNGGPINFNWSWKAEESGKVSWALALGILPTSLGEDSEAVPEVVQTVCLQEEAVKDKEYLAHVTGMRLPKDSYWYFRLSRMEEDAGHNVRISPVFLEYANE